MNASDAEPAQSTLQSGLEVRSRLVLEEGLSRIDARTRSRLNQARQAAVAEAAQGSALAWLQRAFTRHALMPAGAALPAAPGRLSVSLPAPRRCGATPRGLRWQLIAPRR